MLSSLSSPQSQLESWVPSASENQALMWQLLVPLCSPQRTNRFPTHFHLWKSIVHLGAGDWTSWPLEVMLFWTGSTIFWSTFSFLPKDWSPDGYPDHFLQDGLSLTVLRKNVTYHNYEPAVGNETAVSVSILLEAVRGLYRRCHSSLVSSECFQYQINRMIPDSAWRSPALQWTLRVMHCNIMQ